ncbi:MAG: hypothetical protein WCR46_13035 [Deltaproteobacteria bacterium]|jgi:hypothetical protein
MTTYQSKVHNSTWMAWVLLSAGLIVTIYASTNVAINIDADGNFIFALGNRKWLPKYDDQSC